MPKEIEEEIFDPGEVPAYMVSFGDMITLLLTFFILLVAMADTQSAGLVGAGAGPLIKHINSEGEPGVMKGHLQEVTGAYKRDSWWIPDQEGDRDQLEVVREKLEEELKTKFKAEEASISYSKGNIRMRFPGRIVYNVFGKPTLSPELRKLLKEVSNIILRNPKYHVRINADIAPSTSVESELEKSAELCNKVFTNLGFTGTPTSSMSIWAWGSSRKFKDSRSTKLNDGIILEIIDSSIKAKAKDLSE